MQNNMISIKTDLQGRAVLRISDLSGRRLIVQEVMVSATSPLQADISSLSKGRYLISLDYSGGEMVSEMLVVE